MTDAEKESADMLRGFDRIVKVEFWRKVWSGLLAVVGFIVIWGVQLAGLYLLFKIIKWLWGAA